MVIPGYLNELDHSVFLFLNGWHSPVIDLVMYWGTQKLVWFPLFLLMLYFTIRIYRLNTITIILVFIITITISDQSANIAKSNVQRLRPSNDPRISEQVHVVNGYRGGQFGFYSSHASNTMAIAIFLILLLRSRYRWVAAVLLPWALFMSYTRVYLGVHYPGDLLTGMIAGAVIGWLGAQLCGYLISLRFFDRSDSTEA